MSTYKKLTSKDVIITPFEVNKSFSFSGSAITASDVGIDSFIGYNIPSSILFVSDSSPTTGLTNEQLFSRLVYNNIKQVYYGNYLSGSNLYGYISNAATASFNTDGTITGLVYTTNYYDYIENTIYNPTGSGVFPSDYPRGTLKPDPNIFNTASVISIPKKLFGDNIVPSSFSYRNNNGIFLYDDSQGNIYANNLTSSTDLTSSIGNIFYRQGIITAFVVDSLSDYFPSSGMLTISNLEDAQISFSSSLTLYETQYKCTIRENEFNYSMNPTLLVSGGLDQIINGKATYQDFATGSDFSPYVTTVGLYDEDQNLLAVGKLAKPLPTSRTTDTTIIINLDLN